MKITIRMVLIGILIVCLCVFHIVLSREYEENKRLRFSEENERKWKEGLDEVITDSAIMRIKNDNLDLKVTFEFSDGTKREYFIQEKLVEKIFAGHVLQIQTCHPKYAEMIEVKLLDNQYKKIYPFIKNYDKEK